jgi:hypothetical protein
MNPFPNPETVNSIINKEVNDYIQNTLQKDGKFMFYDAMDFLERSINAKDLERSMIIAWYITRSLLKSSMTANDRDFLIVGMKEQIDALEEQRDPETFSEHR